ncbi:peptidoglycan DD-metalloendopeptidase family protein [Enterococcus olivae]
MKIKSLFLVAVGALVLLPHTVGASEIEEQIKETTSVITMIEEQQTTASQEQVTIEEQLTVLTETIKKTQAEIQKLEVSKREQEATIETQLGNVAFTSVNQIQQSGPAQIGQQLRMASANNSHRNELLQELQETTDALEEQQVTLREATEELDTLQERQQTLTKEDQELSERLMEEEEKLVDLKEQEKIEKRGFAMPLEGPITISSRFGFRNDPTGVSGTQHNGIDFTGPMGQPILAARNGVVVEAAFGSGQGNCVILQHDNGYYSYYMHLTEISVSVGQTVTVGEQVGTMGTTGTSTGVHLHFGLSTSLWSNYVDPAGLL